MPCGFHHEVGQGGLNSSETTLFPKGLMARQKVRRTGIEMQSYRDVELQYPYDMGTFIASSKFYRKANNCEIACCTPISMARQEM